MARLLITGGAGFIGSHIVETALAAGFEVRILDSLRPDVHGDMAELPAARPGLTVVRGDVTDPSQVDDALTEIDVVVHEAAKVGLGVSFEDAPDYVHSNETGTAVLLAAMARLGLDRLVLASSMVVYGEGRYRDSKGAVHAPPRTIAALEAGQFEPVSPRTGELLEPQLIEEDAAPDPRNVYASTKLGQEYLTTSWARSTGGRAALLRYHNVYGPRMPFGTPYAGVASLFRTALERSEAPRVFEDGRQRRDFVHVRDVASANLAAIEWTAQQTPGTARAFNVGSGEVHTIGDIAFALSSAVAGPTPIVTGEFRLGDVRHITASSQRIRDEMGWRPTVEFDDGVREFATDPLRNSN
ncbi:MAG TPA: SDR family NAD(P)-dependent oxidoreductase [Galbitalea sp.]